MEKSEPTLVPQWLKSTGSIGGIGNAMHTTGSSTLQSDDHAATLPSRSRLIIRTGDRDSSRSSSFSNRIPSSYSRRNSNCNGSVMHEKDPATSLRSYSSFNRSNRDRDREKNLRDVREKERLPVGDYRNRDYHDPLSSDLLTNRTEKDRLRRSQSLISGKRGEVWPNRGTTDLTCSNNSNHQSTLGAGASVVKGTQKVAFDRDFPTLGAEEKQGGSDTGRVSPGLSTAVQMLPISSSAVIGGSGWTSALAEVPSLKESNGMGPLPAQQAITPVSSATGASSISTGLNMAETLAQAPSRARTSPQVSLESQRLEELAIKQSRQLIPKTLVLNSEKLKPKAAIRNEASVTTRNGGQQLSSSNLVNLSPRNGPSRPDMAKTIQGGKLLVLKAPWEKNGITHASVTDDNVSPTNSCKSITNLLPNTPSTSTRPRSPGNPTPSVADRKMSLPVINSSSFEKKPSVSQSQSRNHFFDLMRKKTSTHVSSVADSSTVTPPSTALDHSGELLKEVATAVSPPDSNGPLSAPSIPDKEIGVIMTSDESKRFPQSRVVAFLHLLGWTEDADEEPPSITEEEIEEFNKRRMEYKPSSRPCRDLQREKLQMPLLHSQSLYDTSGYSSSSSSSSDSESDV